MAHQLANGVGGLTEALWLACWSVKLSFPRRQAMTDPDDPQPAAWEKA